MGNENVRAFGFEGSITVIQALVPQAVADATPILSSAIDTRSYPRTRIVGIFSNNEVGATAYTVAATFTESATSDGEYTACTTSGTLTALSADGVQIASIARNPAKPFIKATLTGSNADVDAISGINILFIGPEI